MRWYKNLQCNHLADLEDARYHDRLQPNESLFYNADSVYSIQGAEKLSRDKEKRQKAQL